MVKKVDVDTPEGAYWMDVMNEERSIEDYLQGVQSAEGLEALIALRRGAEDLIHEIDEGQIGEGEI